MIDYYQYFNTIDDINLFSRVDAIHPLELYIGIDDKGRKAIELREKFTPQHIFDTASLAVTQYHKEEYNTVRFSLCNDEMTGLFYIFCDDLVEQTRSISNGLYGYTAIIDRFYLWKKMFFSIKKDRLSEAQIMGLIGEIMFLKDNLIQFLGSNNALRSWSGQELTHKDFSYDDTWFEVKTVHSGADSVQISSLEQLDSNKDGVLVVYVLEKMANTYNGITLNSIVLQTIDVLNKEEIDLFLSKLALQGYEYNDYYNDFVFEFVNLYRYNVCVGFPRLTRSDIPNAIQKVKYNILFSEISDYLIAD